MKKFKFSLDSVLSYKQQILDSLQSEHGAILARMRAKEEELDRRWREYRQCNEEYQHRAAQGLAMTDVLMYQSRLRAMEREIQRATQELEDLKKQEEAKRAEVVEAKKESASIEKLKDKKLAAYHKEAAKQEEQFIEEFVSITRIAGSAGV